jgi:hypothetical protein
MQAQATRRPTQVREHQFWDVNKLEDREPAGAGCGVCSGTERQDTDGDPRVVDAAQLGKVSELPVEHFDPTGLLA